MKSKKNIQDSKKGKQSQRFRKQSKPMRRDLQDMAEDMPVRKSPDVNRIVDNIFQKYNDFGIMDRD
jgi:hypothetical protein